MEIAKVYEPVFTTKKRKIYIKSGRNAGKSKVAGQLTVKNIFAYDRDALICRSNYGDLQKSMFQEVKDVLEEEHLIQWCEFRTRPLKIINKLNGNTIHFEGVGGADLSRTKGFKPNKKLSLIMFDELQQLPDQSNLDQALATFLRHLDDDIGKVLMCFNPEPQNSHWCNELYRIEEDNENVLTIWTSYKDIAKYLTKGNLEEIELEKVINNSNYRYLYLGETNGLLGGVYYTFNRSKHLLKRKYVMEQIQKYGIHQVLVGVDGATTVDATAVIPVAILSNGQAITLDYMHHNPKKSGAIDNSRLVPLIERFIEELKDRYNLRMGNKPIHFIIDSANADLIQHMQYKLGNRYRVWAYTNKKIIQMAQVMQNAFSKNILMVMDTEGVYNYVSNRWERIHPLVTALESVIWDEKGKGFDPKVPNDDTDALTYAVSYYFLNPNNLHFPEIKQYYDNMQSEVEY